MLKALLTALNLAISAITTALGTLNTTTGTINSTLAAMPGAIEADADHDGFLSKENYAIFLAKQAAITDGMPFRKTVVLTSALATTPVVIVADAAVGSGKKVYITDVLASVGGTDVWAGTGTKVIVRDKHSSPVTAIEFAKAQLGANAVLGKTSTGVTLATPVRTGAGMTATKGIEVVADGTFETTGSDLSVTVCGFIGA